MIRKFKYQINTAGDRITGIIITIKMISNGFTI
jgi:hypothetical protein